MNSVYAGDVFTKFDNNLNTSIATGQMMTQSSYSDLLLGINGSYLSNSNESEKNYFSYTYYGVNSFQNSETPISQMSSGYFINAKFGLAHSYNDYNFIKYVGVNLNSTTQIKHSNSLIESSGNYSTQDMGVVLGIKNEYAIDNKNKLGLDIGYMFSLNQQIKQNIYTADMYHDSITQNNILIRPEFQYVFDNNINMSVFYYDNFPILENNLMNYDTNFWGLNLGVIW